MKKVIITVALLSAVLYLPVAAQQAKHKKPAATATGTASDKPKETPLARVTLNHWSVATGALTKHQYDSLAKGQLYVDDPKYPGAVVEKFTYIYGERNLYEDSTGNMMMVTDYLSEPCLGDTLSSSINESLFHRTKNGDTAYYSEIVLRMADGSSGVGLPLKLTITK